MTRDEFLTKYEEPTYIGDGVYAKFDGYQIWLHLNGDCSGRGIALEPSTFNSLISFQKRLMDDARTITNGN